MGGRSRRRVGRVMSCVAVALFHIGLLAVLTSARQAGVLGTRSSDFTSTFIVLAPPAQGAVDLRGSPVSHEEHPISPVERPPIPPPQIRLESDRDTPVDWVAEARHEAGVLAGSPQGRALTEIPDGTIGLWSPQSSAKHAVGEQYRSGSGEWIVWVNDHCYITSDVAALGVPDALARSLPTRTICEGDSSVRGDLFKDLSAYKRLHPR